MEIKEKSKLKVVVREKEITDDQVVLELLEQNEWCFPRMEIRVNGFHLEIASCNCIEVRHLCNGVIFFLEGSDDKHSGRKLRLLGYDFKYREYVKRGFERLGLVYLLKGEEYVKEEEEKVEDAVLIKYDIKPTEDDIKEMIKKVDYKTFEAIIKSRICLDESSSGEFKKELSSFVNKKWVETYLREWAYSKFRMYIILGRNLKVDKEIEVDMPNDVTEKVREIIDKFPLYAPILEKIDEIAYRDNVVRFGNGSRFYLDKRVTRGMKLTKFISLFGCKELDQELSKIYQEKGKKKITISIDPIDYLTGSINKSGWESCHHFFSGGYRNAGLAYMFDEVSMIAYVSSNVRLYESMSSGKIEFPFECNSKQWRQMIYLSKNNSAVVFSRQYPFSSEEIGKNIRELWEKMYSDFYKIENSWCVTRNIEVLSGNVVKNQHNPYVYNDVACGFEYVVASNKKDMKRKETGEIAIGVERLEKINSSQRIDEHESLWY